MAHGTTAFLLCALATLAVQASARCPFAARALLQAGPGSGGGGSRCFNQDEVLAAAANTSGVTVDEAYAFKTAGLYARLGEEAIRNFSTAFYTHVYSDEWEWYRNLFEDHPLEASIQNQAEFLIEQFGGPSYFTQRKGPFQMLKRHAEYPCNETTAERWLYHAQHAFSAVPTIDAESKEYMESFFRFFAYYLVEGQAARAAAGCGTGNSDTIQGSGRGNGEVSGWGKGKGRG